MSDINTQDDLDDVEEELDSVMSAEEDAGEATLPTVRPLSRRVTTKTRRVLPTFSWLQLISMIIGCLIGLGIIGAGLATFGARLAEGDFVTVEAADKRDTTLREEADKRDAAIHAEMQRIEQAAKEREAKLLNELEKLQKQQADSNKVVIERIDNIYNILVRGGR